MKQMVKVAILACVLGGFNVAFCVCIFGLGSDCLEQYTKECETDKNVDSCINAGDAYEKNGVPKNAKKYYKQAIEILEEKCETGGFWGFFKDVADKNACKELGKIYENGLGTQIERNPTKSQEYFQKACSNENRHTREACLKAKK